MWISCARLSGWRDATIYDCEALRGSAFFVFLGSGNMSKRKRGTASQCSGWLIFTTPLVAPLQTGLTMETPRCGERGNGLCFFGTN